MKQIIITLIILIAAHLSLAQLPGNFNLISNSSFEFNSSLSIVALDDTTFTSNGYCWVKANELPIPIYGGISYKQWYLYSYNKEQLFEYSFTTITFMSIAIS